MLWLLGRNPNGTSIKTEVPKLATAYAMSNSHEKESGSSKIAELFDHCKNFVHTQDCYFDLHGYPFGWQSRNHDQHSKMADVAAMVDPPS